MLALTVNSWRIALKNMPQVTQSNMRHEVDGDNKAETLYIQPIIDFT